MKKPLSVLLAMCMLLALFAGCGKADAPAEEEEPRQTLSAAHSQTPNKPQKDSAPQEKEPVSTEPATEAAKDTFTVYAWVPSNWSDIRIWAWDTTLGDAFPTWPGDPMAAEDSGWYTYEVPNWCSYVIVNGINGSVQSVDIPVEPKSVWLVINSDQTCHVSYTPVEDPLSLSEPSANSAYSDIFTSRGIQDTATVAHPLNSLSAVLLADNHMVMKVEFGYSGETVKEISYVYYFSTSGMTEEEKLALDSTTKDQFQILNEIDDCNARFNMYKDYYCLTLRLNCLDNPDSMQDLADTGLLSEFEWIFSLPTISDIHAEFEAQGIPMK